MIGSCIASFITIWVGPIGPAWDGAVDNAIDYWREQGVIIEEVDYAMQAKVTVERRKMDKDVGGQPTNTNCRRASRLVGGFGSIG